MSKLALEMRHIEKSFYGVKVLDEASLQVLPGEVHVLLGENGAGKSTLIKILSCAYRREGGQILIDGEEVFFADPKEALDNGISVIYQEFNLNPYVSIYENILLGREFVNKAGKIDKAKSIDFAERYLEMIGLDVDPCTLVGDLSVAQKQMVEIAKAISTNVKILVLDEPTASITEKETKNLFEIINYLKAEGIGIIYISHRMSELFEIGDRCTVMRDGQYVQTVNLKESSVEELTKLMVGRTVSFDRWQNPYVDPEKTILKVENLVSGKEVKGVSFELKKGEILGMSGLVGAGRSEIAKCIIGARHYSEGVVTLNNMVLPQRRVDKTIKAGIVYLSEDRKDEGLVLIHSLVDNVALPNLDQFNRFKIDKKELQDRSIGYLKKTTVKMASPYVPAQTLSGGNQQKVVIGKWLMSDANVYIFDEPTRGIDVGARDEIYDIMKELIKNGVSIIMISSDMVEIQKMCNRVIVMKEGKITANLINNEQVTQEKLLSYALGEE